jgi:hypothetical protein
VKEKQIQNEIIHFLRILGVYCWTNNSVGIYDPVKKIYRKNRSPNHLNGVSDILGIIGGRFLAIEVKSEKGVLRPEQRIFLAHINEEGGVAFVARSLRDVAVNLSRFFPDNEGLKKMVKNYIPEKMEEH